MKEDIIYFTRNPLSPCSRAVYKRNDVKIVNPDDDYAEILSGARAAIADEDPEGRQDLIKALLKEKLPYGSAAWGEGVSGEVCWLGSWRYEWAMARLKEVITSGVLGAMQQFKLTKPEGLGIFERLRDEELLNWLSAYGNDAACAFEEMPGAPYQLTAIGARGSATATILGDGMNEFALALCDEPPRVETHPSAPMEAEIGYLLFAVRSGRPWTMLGRIPN